MTPSAPPPRRSPRSSSLATEAAAQLATTAKTPPQMRGISPRWLLRVLPWVQVSAGTFRVNHRLVRAPVGGRVPFTSSGAEVRVVPAGLAELPLLTGFRGHEALAALAAACEQREYRAGQVLAEEGRPRTEVLLLAHGKAERRGTGPHGGQTRLAVLAGGGYAGEEALTGEPGTWRFTLRALTRCTVLALPADAVMDVARRAPGLRAHLDQAAAHRASPANSRGEAEVALASGHAGEPVLPGTFVDYEAAPREYELSVAQTVLRVHSRVADLYNKPMNQVEEQLRLTVEALRERQEHELVNNREFGLLHNADPRQRLHTRLGPPTPDDLDELLARRRRTEYLLAHPSAIAAFGRECSSRGLYPATVEHQGRAVPAWRGIPLLPSDKIPVSGARTTAILALRTGREHDGVVGLHQAGIPEEYEPSLNVRFMGINDQAVMSYLVSAYFSAAVLVPDALGVLHDVEV